MAADDSLPTAWRQLRSRAPAVVPAFLAETAIGIAVQSIGVVTILLAYLSLRGTGRIDRVLAALEAVDPPVTVADDVQPVADAVAGLFTPTAVALLAVGGVLVAVTGVLGRAIAAALKVHTVRAAYDPDAGAPLTAGVTGVRRHTRTFVRFVLLQVAVFLGPLAVAAAGAAAGGSAGTALFALAVLAWIPAIFVGYFGLLFAPEAIVVHDVGVREGIRRNLSYLSEYTGQGVIYAGVEVGALVGLGLVGGALSALGVGRLVGVVALVVVAPWLGLLKMRFYLAPDRRSGRTDVDPGTDDGRRADRHGRESPTAADRDPGRSDPHRSTTPGEPGPSSDPTADGESPDERSTGERSPDERSTGGRSPEERPPRQGETDRRAAGVETLASVARGVRRELRTGHGVLRSFVADHAALVVVALGAFAVGAGGGYALTAPFEVVTGGGSAGFGAVPLEDAVQLAANNWLVAVAQAFAGLAFGIPVLVNLGFNGLLVGGLAGLGFDLRVFLALVVPHGIIEVPALAVSGAVGLHLGARALGFVRGRVSDAAMADDLSEAFYVLVGLAPWFVLAAVIEAFLTPWIGDVVRAAVAP